jgi:DnaJ-class molecular chaperone
VEDPYKVLGVTREASADEIRAEYRTLAKQYHPDLNPGDKAAEERFKAISAAYELLSDPEKRERYDRGEIDASGAERPPERPFYHGFAEGRGGGKYHRGEDIDAEDLNDIFASFFGRGRGTGGAAGAGGDSEFRLRGEDRLYMLPVDFVDAVVGARRRLTLPDGKSLDVTIPPGTEDAQVLRLRGQGGPGLNGGPPGDALIEVHVAPHPFFRRDGDDIHIEVPVTLAEAVLGGRITVPTPSGPVAMTVPKQSDSGTRLRLRGKGVPAHRGRAAGDQYVTLRIVLGENAADRELAEFLERWAPGHAFDPRRSMLQS